MAHPSAGWNTLTAMPPLRSRVVCQDALAFLADLPDACVDLVITDPAYASLERHRARGTTPRLTKTWFPIFANNAFPALFAQLYRVLKPHTHFYMLCDQETMFITKPMAVAAGFKFWKPLIWDKVHIGMGYHYRARYECILFFEKGRRRLASLRVPDVLTHKRVRNGYPTEKPVALLRQLITQSSAAGDLVVDVFAGAGSVGVAALTEQRRFLGCDVVPAACYLANRRLRQVNK